MVSDVQFANSWLKKLASFNAISAFQHINQITNPHLTNFTWPPS
jgi:hypothetical protein